MAEFTVAKIGELEAGSKKVVFVNNKAIALFNVDGTFYAIDNRCPHMGAPLCDGTLEEKIISCPAHGWEFDIKTGECLSGGEEVKKYEVKAEGNLIKIIID